MGIVEVRVNLFLEARFVSNKHLCPLNALSNLMYLLGVRRTFYSLFSYDRIICFSSRYLLSFCVETAFV